MTRFTFPPTVKLTKMLPTRVSELTFHKIKSIAQQKEVPTSEVIRQLVDIGLEEFQKEYPKHYFNQKEQ
jgi:hypothetical protein